MNDKFYSLPKEKQQRILNAGYRVFSQNTYKKSPMSEIAAEAGISKSLLFHYFRNKKEFYLFLWQNCADNTMARLKESACYEQPDLFDLLYLGLHAKIRIMGEYPYMAAFALKAVYEKDPEIRPAIQESYQYYLDFSARITLDRLDPAQFRPGLDLTMMYKEMYWASEGYIWELMQRNELDQPFDLDKLERDFLDLVHFWKTLYLRQPQPQSAGTQPVPGAQADTLQSQPKPATTKEDTP